MSYALLRDGDRVLIPPMMLFAVYLLMAGHNRPGGGFVAGLTIASAIVLRGQARGATEALKIIRVSPLNLLAIGLMLAVLVGGTLMVAGDGFLDMVFTEVELPLFGVVKFTSAFPFDVGVTLLVVGVVAAIVEAFGEEVPE